MQIPKDLLQATKNFQIMGDIVEIAPYGTGHINHTYRLICRSSLGTYHNYILQKINQNVFREPEKLMENFVLVTDHLRHRIIEDGRDPSRRTITLIPTHSNEWLTQTPDGEYWRVENFIEGANTYLQAQNIEQYYHAAHAFGQFQSYLTDLHPANLHATIPDFHHTGKRFQNFLNAVDEDKSHRAKNVQAEIGFAQVRESETTVLIDLISAGKMPERVTHNDTKLDNVMLDDKTGEGICVIDLDTVMPGLAVFDFGDTVRSCCNPSFEDEPDLSQVRFNLQTFDLLARGFLDATRNCLTPIEIDHLAFGAKLITFEQGLRFLTDYINGDIYYKIHRPNHNLERARTQFKLIADMEAAFNQMQQIIEKYR